MKICSVCGITEEETKMYGNLCRKHYLQIKRHGKVLERTIYDKNPIEIKGDIAFMHCFDKNGNETGVARFNARHIDRVSKHKWYIRTKQHMQYVMGSTGPNTKTFLHRFLLNAPRDVFVDHIDHDTMNNLDENLRICSKKENSRNRRYNSSRQYPGVFQQYTTNDRWSAVITVDYKNIWLGVFNTFEEAVNAKKAAEEKYFGEFRYLGQ